MPMWLRYEHQGERGFGTLDGDVITPYSGDMFAAPEPCGDALKLASVRVLAPTTPTKMIALWNNFRALGAKLGVPPPEEPLFLLKANSSFLDPGIAIRRPASYKGKIVYEGELAIVIGAACTNASAAEAQSCIFGYTCVNDVTAADIIQKDPTFAQWARAKSFDGFSPFGPVIATDVLPEELWVRTILNGEERQNYPISDMVFPAAELVSRLSHDMTLFPGDIICCGTSLGVGSIREQKTLIEVEIAGIGTLRNEFLQ